MEYIFNNLNVLEQLRKGIIPSECQETIQKMGNYYFDKVTEERYYYNSRAFDGTSIEVLYCPKGLVYTKEYKRFGNDVILICTINDVLIRDVAEFEKCKRYRVFQTFTQVKNNYR